MRLTVNLDIAGLKIGYQYTLSHEAKDQETVADLKLAVCRQLVSVLAQRDEDCSIQIDRIQFTDSEFQALADTVKLSSLNIVSGIAHVSPLSPLISPKHPMRRARSQRNLERKFPQPELPEIPVVEPFYDDESQVFDADSESEWFEPKPLWQSIWSGLKWIVRGLLNCICCCFIRDQSEPESESEFESESESEPEQSPLVGARNTRHVIQRLPREIVKPGATATATGPLPVFLQRSASLGALPKNRSLERLNRRKIKARKKKDAASGGVQFKVK